ncbi:MAG: tRNA (adenosine(37)-N6)-threonylcarbamoyltransferase complex transferase subunit TsaD [Bacteroidetes bacterium]|nr:tRNA (adenosine(37)-N6)-threonylcarbamoyltransferase complex transferase subunit TsaD [Bacteroidota bacterium]
MIVLGIETSCDETSAAILIDGEVKSNIISSQLVHHKYGGVVPELASRAHQRLIVPVVDEAINSAGITKEQIDGVAVTYGPGLAGALLVGLNFAKAFAYKMKVPFVGVNHIEAHLYSNFLGKEKPQYPFICLIVSGGHTQLVYVKKPFEYDFLGETLDDAAGEAYDKVAKMLGLGFPGGPQIDKLAQTGNPKFVKFPRSFLDEDSFNFSFSGLKTSVLYWLKDRGYYPITDSGNKIEGQKLSDVCASFQAAVADVLVGKTIKAVEKYKVDYVTVSGGVSANSELRKKLYKNAEEKAIKVFFPELDYCTDNGAMIALVGWLLLKEGITSDYNLNAVANLPITGNIIFRL